MSTGTAALQPYPDDQRGTTPQTLRTELLATIRRAIDEHPRSQQKRIGPSEIGTPCVRRLGHKLAGTPETNASADGWKATIGTAVHAWLAEAFVEASRHERGVLAEALGVMGAQTLDGGDPVQSLPTRWLVEQRVQSGAIDGVTLDGSCDLFDRATGAVVDWKVTSLANVRKYRANGPGEQYRVQAHTYGIGWAARGERPELVAVVFLPRDGDLRHAHLWAEPFDPQIATASIARADAVATAIRQAGAAAVLPGLPTAPAYCAWCPFYRKGSNDLVRSCPGHSDSAAGPSSSNPLDGIV